MNIGTHQQCVLQCYLQQFLTTRRKNHQKSKNSPKTTRRKNGKTKKILIGKELEKSGDIYLSKYSGWYSVSDEAFYNEDEIESKNSNKIS